MNVNVETRISQINEEAQRRDLPVGLIRQLTGPGAARGYTDQGPDQEHRLANAAPRYNINSSQVTGRTFRLLFTREVLVPEILIATFPAAMALASEAVQLHCQDELSCTLEPKTRARILQTQATVPQVLKFISRTDIGGKYTLHPGYIAFAKQLLGRMLLAITPRVGADGKYQNRDLRAIAEVLSLDKQRAKLVQGYTIPTNYKADTVVVLQGPEGPVLFHPKAGDKPAFLCADCPQGWVIESIPPWAQGDEKLLMEGLGRVQKDGGEWEAQGGFLEALAQAKAVAYDGAARLEEPSVSVGATQQQRMEILKKLHRRQPGVLHLLSWLDTPEESMYPCDFPFGSTDRPLWSELVASLRNHKEPAVSGAARAAWAILSQVEYSDYRDGDLERPDRVYHVDSAEEMQGASTLFREALEEDRAGPAPEEEEDDQGEEEGEGEDDPRRPPGPPVRPAFAFTDRPAARH